MASFTQVSPNNPVRPSLPLYLPNVPTHLTLPIQSPSNTQSAVLLMKLPTMQSPAVSVSQFLSATNISLCSPFSNILSLCSSLSKRQQVLCTYINIQTIAIILINCNLVVTRWQWLFYMYTNMKKELENLSLEGYTRKI